MRIFKAFYLTNIKANIEYRTTVLIWIGGSAISTLFLAYYWLITTPDATGLVGTYTKNGLVTYTFLSFILQQIIGWYPFDELQYEIKEGEVTNYLLKPVSILSKFFASESAYHTLSIFLQSLSLGVLILLLHPYLEFASIHFSFISVGILLLSAVLVFLLQMCMGLLVFWVVDTGPLQALFWICISILGGEWFPNSLLPKLLHTINSILPFRYTFAFPLEVILQRISPLGLLYGTALQLGWIIVLYLLFRWLWVKGVQRYDAIGR